MPNGYLTRAAPLFTRSRQLVQGAASEVVDGGTSADIQGAIDALTPGRTWQEKVKLRGRFRIDDSVLIDSYTWVDATEAYCVAKDALNKDMFRNRHFNGVDGSGDPDDQYISWEGGILDGNKANQTAAAQDPITNDPICNLLLSRVPNLQVMHLRSHSSGGTGFKLTGRFSGGETTETHTVHDIQTWNNYYRGTSIQNGLRNGIYSSINSKDDVTAGGAAQGAIFIGHSEGIYQGLFVEGSGAQGIYINNVRNIQLANVQVKASVRHGIYVIGFVTSQATNIKVANSSTASPGTYSDLYLSDDDSWGYGVTKRCYWQIFAGEDISGQATSKAAIEWQDTGVDAAGTTLTANEDIVIDAYINEGGFDTTEIVYPAVSRRGSIQVRRYSQGDARPTVSTNGIYYPGSTLLETDQQNNSNDLQSHAQLVYVSATTASRTKALPAAATAGPGKEITIQKNSSGTGTVTVTVASGEYLNGTQNGTAAWTVQRGFVTVRSDGVDNWDILASRLS